MTITRSASLLRACALLAMLTLAAPAALADATYLRLDPMTVPVMRDGVVRAHLTFVFTLALADASAHERAAALKLRLRDAFMRDLHAMAARRGVEKDGLDLEVVKHRLRGTAARVLGADAGDVLIHRSIIRRF